MASSSDVSEKSAAGLSGQELWDEVRIEPVEIALPGGVGLTLRAFRKSSELTPTEIEAEEEDPFDARRRVAAAEDDEEEVILDEEFQALLAEGEVDQTVDEDAKAAADSDEPDPEEFEDDTSEDDAKAADEDVPMFLSHKGKLLAFKSKISEHRTPDNVPASGPANGPTNGQDSVQPVTPDATPVPAPPSP